MELRVLGPLEVRREGRPVPLPGGKPLVLLARLLVEAGRVVSVDALADALWRDALPANVAATVQVYVSNLRRALGPSMIATRSPGYAASIDGHELDARELEALVSGARDHRAGGRPLEGLADARRAVALVRGEPFHDVAFEDWAKSEVMRLGALCLAAHEEVHGALLDLDRHHESLPGLESLVAAHPFHERLRAQLMTAFYRDGRQADALRCYAEGRRLLVEELGVEPGAELQQAEARVLAQDDLLLAGPSRVRAAATVAPPDGRRDEPGLVGREGPRESLVTALRDAAAGRLRVAVVEGEAGVGKTALARWLMELAAGEGCDVGAGRAHDLAGSSPYWVWTSALRDLVRSTGTHALSAAVDTVPGARVLGTLLPELAGAAEEPSAQFQVFDAVGRTLDHLSAGAPVVLVLDDLHWADQASLDLLQFLARMPTGARVLLVVTHRSVPATHPLAALMARIAAEACVVRIPLGPLGTDEVGQLLERLAGPVDHEAVAVIDEKTGGNPFFVEELVKLLRVPGGLDLGRARVPDTVRGVVTQRAAGLGERAVELLTLVSFASDTFTGALPRRLLSMDRATVTETLEHALLDGLIVEVAGRPGFYRFAHDMVRHAFYDSVPQQRRAETHLALGQGLVELLGQGAEAHAPELADHFLRAVAVGGAGAAVHWSRQAAAQAVRSLAYADALRHLRQALLVTRRWQRDERTECEVLLEVAAAARLAADPPTAQVARERAHRLATRLGDPTLTARASNVLLGPGPHWLRSQR